MSLVIGSIGTLNGNTLTVEMPTGPTVARPTSNGESTIVTEKAVRFTVDLTAEQAAALGLVEGAGKYAFRSQFYLYAAAVEERVVTKKRGRK